MENRIERINKWAREVQRECESHGPFGVFRAILKNAPIVECPACYGIFAREYWEEEVWLKHPNTGCIYSCHVAKAGQWQKWCESRLWLSGYSPLEAEENEKLLSAGFPEKQKPIMSPIFELEDVEVSAYWDPDVLWREWFEGWRKRLKYAKTEK